MFKSFFNKKNIVVLASVIAIAFIFAIVPVINSTVLNLNSEASTNRLPNYDNYFPNKCIGKINVSVSADGVNFSNNIHLPEGASTYYLRVRNESNQPCSGNFDVSAKSCDLNNSNCSAYGTIRPWYYYTAAQNGIARIDWQGKLPSNTAYAKFKPRGQNVELSNEITVKVGGELSQVSLQEIAATEEVIDFSKYFKFNIGDSYIYNGYSWMASPQDVSSGRVDQYKRKVNPIIGTGRLVIEEPVMWGDVKSTPWRFLKDKHEMYWQPKDPFNPISNNSFLRDENLRWMVTSADYRIQDNNIRSFNNFFSSIGHKSYERQGGVTGLRDLGSKWNRTYNYSSMNTQFPAYNLGPKKFAKAFNTYSAPMVNYYEATGADAVRSRDADDFIKNPKYYITGKTANMGWFLRTSRSKPITIGGKVYSDVIRYDFYEGNFSLQYGAIFRESWYFAKDIGLVRIDVKYFERDTSRAKVPCYADTDCTSDDINFPHVRWDLKTYQPNTQIEVEVSASKNNGYCPSNRNNICSVTINNQTQTYYLRAKNSTYTGYIEAKAISNPYSPTPGQPTKWYWMENGIVEVPLEAIKDLRKGSYKAQFRIWVPNEQFTNEVRLDESNVPWSNTIEIIHR